ncbi:MAG TPA: hypothetical protein VKB28_22170 [Solirubrobacteraceae bacterium]|nr:hypothetical protein [Solirubrobacteraceae bacterium]
MVARDRPAAVEPERDASRVAAQDSADGAAAALQPRAVGVDRRRRADPSAQRAECDAQRLAAVGSDQRLAGRGRDRDRAERRRRRPHVAARIVVPLVLAGTLAAGRGSERAAGDDHAGGVQGCRGTDRLASGHGPGEDAAPAECCREIARGEVELAASTERESHALDACGDDPAHEVRHVAGGSHRDEVLRVAGAPSAAGVAVG